MSAEAVTWQRWEAGLESAHPAPDWDKPPAVTLKGPDGAVLHTFGFWDGGRRFGIRAAFPTAGRWTWQTACPGDPGLDGRCGAVEVRPYVGEHPLYRHGLPRVSANRRFLVHADGTPFFWLGDTAWAAPLRASAADWEDYLTDRAAHGFSVVQLACAATWNASTDTDGHPPLLGPDLRPGTAYLRGLADKVQRANERGLCVLLAGLMEPGVRSPPAGAAQRFARAVAARLHGNFVIFSPSFDSPYLPLGDAVGGALRATTSQHLITQHVGTSLEAALAYQDRAYLDFCGVQSGHNEGDRERAARHASEWNWRAYECAPPKPVINLEAFYDGGGTTAGREAKHQGDDWDARSLAWRSWLSGALGYTCGSTGLWDWETDPARPWHWRRALGFPSTGQMAVLREILLALPWWQLAPDPARVLDQPPEFTRRACLARSPQHDLALAYLPEPRALRLDLGGFPPALDACWRSPVTGERYAATAHDEGSGVRTFTPPGDGDWLLVLTDAHSSPAPAAALTG